MNRRAFILQSTRAAVGAALAPPVLALASTSSEPSTELAASSRSTLIPNIELTTQEGQTVRLYDDLIKGKVVAFNFFFVSCRDSCPMTSYNLTRVQKLLGDRLGREVFFYSISLDPDHDRPAVLKSYAELFKAGNGWTFLTGPLEQGNQPTIDYLRRRLGFADPDPVQDRQRENHTGMLRYGNEPRGQWGAMPAIMEPRLLAKEILWLLPSTTPEAQRQLLHA